MSARADQRRSARLCLCGCGVPVAEPRRKDGYRRPVRTSPVRYYATRACALTAARAARARVVAQRERLAPDDAWTDDVREPKPCTYCGEDVHDGRELHRACQMRQARAQRWTRGPYTARPTAAWIES